jgi:hypothetical protein
MKKLNLIISIALLMSTYCLGLNEVSLRQELDILKPFVGKIWFCESADPSGHMTLHFLRRFEAMHDGKILRYYGECKELNSQTDGYYYYDPDKQEIAFLWLTSNGNITVGNVKEEDGKILAYGYAIISSRKLEFRNIYEFTSDGKLHDKWFSFEDGEWKAGHSRVYTAKTP